MTCIFCGEHAEGTQIVNGEHKEDFHKENCIDLEITEEYVLTTPLRELRSVIFKEDKEGNRYRERIIAIIKKIGFSDWALMNDLPTNPEAIYMNRYTKTKFRLDEELSYCMGSSDYKTWEEYINNHFYYTWENSLPVEIWDSDNYTPRDEPTQSKLFSDKDDEELSDEELAEEYPVESGEVEDEVDEEEMESYEKKERNETQSTLFEKPNTRKLVCKCGKEYVVTDKESNFDCSCGKMLVWTIGNEVNYLTPAVAIHSENGAVQSVAEAILKGKIQPIQSTLTGAVANNKEKEKILLAEQEHLNQIWWLKRVIDTIAEVDNGKVFDNNEKDGLVREFEIGSAGFEELGLTEEDFEALSFEQYVKKSLEKIIEFNIQEMGMELEQATIFSYERIENRLAEIEKELELCKTKMKDTKVGEKIVQLSLLQN